MDDFNGNECMSVFSIYRKKICEVFGFVIVGFFPQYFLFYFFCLFVRHELIHLCLFLVFGKLEALISLSVCVDFLVF